MSNSTSRFERHSFELGDLVDTLAEAGIVWGRDFGLVGYPEPDAFELTFQNEALAVRASVLWTAHTMPTMPPEKKMRSKRKKGSPQKTPKPADRSSSSTVPQGTSP